MSSIPMKTRLRKIASNPIFQSAMVGVLVTLLVVSIWDAPIKKFNIQIDPFESKLQEELHWFCGDFNGDGNSEFIRCFNSITHGNFDIVQYDKDGNIVLNWHFNKSKWNYYNPPKIFDLDFDGTQELLFFTTRNDSIFLNALNLVSFELLIDHLYFNTFENTKETYAHVSSFYDYGDFDNDGNNELFFSFDAGFGLYPRGIFKMDYPSLKIHSSPKAYMNLHSPFFNDLNRDGIPEVLTACTAPNNVGFQCKYPDTQSYITILDYNLNFLFEPIPMNDKFSSVQCIPDTNNDSIFYAAFKSRSNSKNPLRVMCLNNNGQIIKQKDWFNLSTPETRRSYSQMVNNIPYLFIRNVGRFKLTESLDLLPDSLDKKINNYDQYPQLFDFNSDGFDELLTWNSKDEVTIFNEKENESLSFVSPLYIKSVFRVYPYLKNHKVSKFFVATGSGFFYLSYHRNKYFYLLYLIYASIFIGISGTIRLLFYYQKRTIVKKWTTEKQLSELQFNSVKNQLNPHFLFNALNSVAYMINEGKKDEAYDFLAINSRMIQSVMNDAKEVKRPLKDEIQFTKDYISIQKHRFKERFTVEFTINAEVDLKIKVPKMCIHTYVENAIKHGFRNTKSGGFLKINISPIAKGVAIAISDNGMGRIAASEYKDSSGNGINIMDEFYSLFEKYHRYRIECRIVDLTEPVGTRIELRIHVPKKD